MTVQAKKRKLRRRHWSPLVKRTILGFAACLPGFTTLQAQEPVAAGAVANLTYLPYAQFKIPFQVESAGNEPPQVQLWVSTDGEQSWQLHGTVPADAKQFDFRAAAEGLYHFKVHTLDASGASFPSAGPPLQVLVDTTKPQAAVEADIDSQGKLVIDVRAIDQHLDTSSAVVRMRSDHHSSWQELPVENLTLNGEIYEGQVVTEISPCREIALVFGVQDQASNSGEASFQFKMPRTAAADQEMTLASTRSQASPSPTSPQATTAKPDAGAVAGGGAPRPASIPGATRWVPSQDLTNSNVAKQSGPGKLAANQSLEPTVSDEAALRKNNDLLLDDSLPQVQVEELPLPAAVEPPHYVGTQPTTRQLEEVPEKESRASEKSSPSSRPLEPSTIGQAYHCKSRAFSLDYSVEALGGSALADVELWGTEDGGRQWQKWGSDPDRQSPFDVQVGTDGLFGFRMVIVGANGLVSNRPREGDNADVWINIDTDVPKVHITRAVYGEGPEDGMLVIDYNCEDVHLVERPITLSYSERAEGEWTTIATGLANTGIYLWKADPNLPDKIYLKMECVDKAGNVGAHRLDLPIDIKGLAPRGIIQGFRPIVMPSK